MAKKKKTEDVIDLSSYEYRDFSEEEVAGFRKVREGSEEIVGPILEALNENPELLGLKNVDYEEVLGHLRKAKELEVPEKLLAQKLERISETRRFHLSEMKNAVDRMVKRAKAVAEEEKEVADLFAPLFDFLAEPSKKAVQTRRKKKEADS